MRLWKPSWGYYWLLILWSCFWPLIRFLCSSHWKSITKTADKNCVLDFSNGNVNFYRIVFLCFMLEIWFLAVCRSNFQKKNMPAIFLSKLNSISNWIYGHCCLSIILQSRAWFFASFVFHSRTEKIGLACLFGPWKVLVFEICDRIHKFKIQTLLKHDNNCNKLHLLSISCHFLKRFLSMHFLSRVHISDKLRSVPDLSFLLVWKTKENRA